MCRNITTLRGLEPPATADEIQAAAVQYIRKVTGITKVTDVTREAFEQMITPAVETTVETFRRTLTAAGITPQDLTAVLLVGGSSQIPLVNQLLRDTLRRPIMINTHPKHAVALGAAMIAVDAHTAHGIPAPRRPEPATPVTVPVTVPITAPVVAPTTTRRIHIRSSADPALRADRPAGCCRQCAIGA